jgi:hypothetical protein
MTGVSCTYREHEHLFMFEKLNFSDTLA